MRKQFRTRLFISRRSEWQSNSNCYSAAEAMAVGNSYAASAYGMTVSPELGFGNASYEFADTAYVSGLKVMGHLRADLRFHGRAQICAQLLQFQSSQGTHP